MKTFLDFLKVQKLGLMNSPPFEMNVKVMVVKMLHRTCMSWYIMLHISLQSINPLKYLLAKELNKNNDFARTTVLKKSNNWNAPADVLKMEARQWALRSNERNKQQYTKRDTDYWASELQETRKKKRKAIRENSA